MTNQDLSIRNDATEVDEMVENESKIINYSPEVVNPHELARRCK